MPNTNPANDSSAELNRIELIGVCQRVLREIQEDRAAKTAEKDARKEARITELMQPRAQFWSRKTVGRTREAATAAYYKERCSEHEYFETPIQSLYAKQEMVVRKVLDLARASDADTVRVTKEDFAQFSSYWRQ